MLSTTEKRRFLYMRERERESSNDALKTSYCVKYNSDNIRHSRKLTCFNKRVRFSISNFLISTLSHLFNVVTADSVKGAYFNIKNGESYISTKKTSFEITEGRRLFSSNVSTLLSLIESIILLQEPEMERPQFFN